MTFIFPENTTTYGNGEVGYQEKGANNSFSSTAIKSLEHKIALFTSSSK